MCSHISTEQAIKTSHGVFMLNVERDAKMAGLLSQNTYPHNILLKAANAYGSGGVVVDVGAHIGTVSVPLVHNARRIIAFEANPETFEYLRRNVEANAVPVDIRNKALSDMSGRASTATINARNAGANTLAAGNAIEVSTLNAEVEEANFIKIDVEGMELAVLRGGEQVIARSKPAIWFEVNLTQLRMHGARVSEIEAWLREHGYVLYLPIWQNGTLSLGSIVDLSLVTFLITPRTWLFGGSCAPFDVLALPREAPMRFPAHSCMRTIQFLAQKQFMQKWHRIVS